MNLLVIGGTRFVGRHIVEHALGRDHSLTLFNRGRSNPGLFEGVEEVHGDRDGDLHLLSGRRWDAVIDTSGYVPRVVQASAELLAQATDRYVFISTISVYADPLAPHSDEDAPLATIEDPTVEEITGETYGALKVLCERAVTDTFGAAALIVRPGLVVGPHDPTDRFTYWPVRVASGGTALAPGEPRRPVQFIDARDLAAWTLDMIEANESGTFNATGPDYRLAMQRVLFECRKVAGSDADFTWVDDNFLLAHDVAPFTELPLWVPGEDGEGFGTVKIDRALAHGLHFRPLTATIADTLQWAASRNANHEWRAGLSAEREAALLSAWDGALAEVK
ncbi:MAG TPA: NAD-dependent epimerase/dehydratase family protein [Candidatus Binatia bacterium]|nr:NAD-dependent epimerase/dehydratase family protein [Candidatus Binatia bacterium]